MQTGLGRTGTVWSHEQEGVEPDALVVGKGLSGGVYPIAALLTSAAMHEVIDAHPFAHSGTFSGAEPGCVAALAVLDVVEEPGLPGARARRSASASSAASRGCRSRCAAAA